jgi:hypothetical protein
MKKTLHQKQNLVARLSGYAVSAGAILALTPTAKGQIVYSGLQNIQLNMPDSIFALNMDGDTVSDFNFIIHGESTISTYPDPLVYIKRGYGFGIMLNAKTDTYKNSWIYRNTYVTQTNTTSLGTITSTYTYPMINGLNTGVQIDSAQTMWKNASSFAYSGLLGYGFMYSYWGAYSGFYAYGYGDFFGQEKYIGVRFYIGNDQHYGWIRASLGDYIDPMTIIDWAYESTPGDSIITGAGDYEGPVPVLDAGLTTTQIQTVNLSLSFAERAYGFDLSKLDITNGTASNLVELIPGKQYTFDITATDEGAVIVELPAGSVVDLSGNENESASETWIHTAPVNIDLNDVQGISIYPNPVSDVLYIKLESEASIKIIDLKGNIIFASEPSREKSIDMSRFNPGVYIVQIQNKDRITQHKIVVD